MKTSANYRTPVVRAPGWLPAGTTPRALDPSRWLTRAARGHTWNGHGAERRRPH